MLIHAPTPLRLCRATSLGAALFALAVGAAAAPPSHAQAAPARDAPGPDGAGLSVALEGSWVRNEELSDDPVANLADHLVGGFVSEPQRELAEDLADRRRSLVIKFPRKDVLVRNAAGTLQLPIDGLTRNFGDGNVITAFLTEDSLEIVTARTNGHWLWIETLYRRGDRLVQVTENQSSGPDLLFHTVYDHADGTQTLEIRAYSDPGRLAGADRIVLNRLDSPFGVRIAEIRSAGPAGHSALHVAANVSVPRTAALQRVAFYRSDHPVGTFDDLDPAANRGEARTIPVDTLIEGISPGDFVRVTAQLTDGREMEDAELLQGAEHRSEIDVQLVQLQILVVDREGNPVGDLTPEDFEISENGVWRPAENLHVSEDVPLVLGIALDSSTSMHFVWRQLHKVVRAFFEGALAADDRAFLVDFDDTIRLLQPPTGNTPTLARRLDRLVPQGGTALNDGILFSLLQYRREPGRRALVVVTDGIDIDSRSLPEQAATFAERSGIPIYFIDLGRDRITLPGRIDGESAGAPQTRAAREDLRHQYVLTYYSGRPPGAAIEPEVTTTRKDLEVRNVLPLYASDQE